MIPNSDAVNGVDDNLPDYRDTDSDDDGLLDWVEANCNAQSDCSNIFLDVIFLGDISWPNSDFYLSDYTDILPDYRDADSDNDDVPDWFEAGCQSEGNCAAIYLWNLYPGVPHTLENVILPDANATNHDNDLPDYRTPDSDDDTILDGYERVCSVAQSGVGPTDPNDFSGACDSDSDNAPDYRDNDSDDDLVLDIVEAGDFDLDTEPAGDPSSILADGDDNGIPAFRDPDDQYIGPPPPTGGVDACLPFAGWPSGGLDEVLLPWGFNRGIACGLQLIRDTLANAGINVTDDPPVPGMLFYNRPFITADVAATTQMAVTAAHTTTSPLDASLTTGHTTIAGDFSAA